MIVTILILRIFLGRSTVVLRSFFALKAKNDRRTTEERAENERCNTFPTVEEKRRGKYVKQ
jgi:hypothetical protein